LKATLASLAFSLGAYQLVSAILNDRYLDVLALRELMLAEYKRLAGMKRRDDFHCGRMASRIATAWTRLPPRAGKVTPTQMAAWAAKAKEASGETVRWAVRALEHFAGRISAAHRKRYQGFIPGTAESMMSLIASRGRFLDQPDAVGRKVLKLRPKLLALAGADPDNAARRKRRLAELYQAVASLRELQRDKQALRQLMERFGKAYNERDEKAMLAICAPGHVATQPLASKSLEAMIPPARWKIERWEPVRISVWGDRATVEMVATYRSRDGKVGPLQYESFRARRVGGVWRLHDRPRPGRGRRPRAR